MTERIPQIDTFSRPQPDGTIRKLQLAEHRAETFDRSAITEAGWSKSAGLHLEAAPTGFRQASIPTPVS
ncbi:hypothetical protein [Stutzerimonas nosocomialis]|uniref:hypothetical protein n=1 Tax=Stutzerimonas nosocomialis TaxID=1056496 RepID=UPI0011098813|nr:hypothetical protein [Stutzerimonas nosocomialis]